MGNELKLPEGAWGGPTVEHAVVVRDVDMRFGSMVTFMVKWVLASIPALLILAVIGFFVTILLSMLLGIFAAFR